MSRVSEVPAPVTRMLPSLVNLCAPAAKFSMVLAVLPSAFSVPSILKTPMWLPSMVVVCSSRVGSTVADAVALLASTWMVPAVLPK